LFDEGHEHAQRDAPPQASRPFDAQPPMAS